MQFIVQLKANITLKHSDFLKFNIPVDGNPQRIVGNLPYNISTQIILKLIDDYEFIEDITVFASGKDGIFNAGTPIGKTTEDGEVELFIDPNQLSFVTVNLIKPSKEVF